MHNRPMRLGWRQCLGGQWESERGDESGNAGRREQRGRLRNARHYYRSGRLGNDQCLRPAQPPGTRRLRLPIGGARDAVLADRAPTPFFFFGFRTLGAIGLVYRCPAVIVVFSPLFSFSLPPPLPPPSSSYFPTLLLPSFLLLYPPPCGILIPWLPFFLPYYNLS